MKGTYTYEYPRPMLTADCVVVRHRAEVLLVRRGNEPYKGCWALPGGFMEMDETIEHCAVRELQEETGISVGEESLALIGVYSMPGRASIDRPEILNNVYKVSCPCLIFFLIH